MIGKCIDEAVLPRDSQQIVHDFLTLPQIDRILPGIAAAPLACACAPRMTVTTATSPFGDRFAIIGDAVGSRLNKDGLLLGPRDGEPAGARPCSRRESTSRLSPGDTGRPSNGWRQTIASDGWYLPRAGWRSPCPWSAASCTRRLPPSARCETSGSRPLSVVLWKIASGTADYREVLREMCGYGVLRSILVGAVVTLRNVAFEVLFGLKWGEYGRYPTVVLKEKREALKEQLASEPGNGTGPVA